MNGWAYLPQKILGLKNVFYFCLFLMSLAIRGNDLFFFSLNKAILELESQKWTTKSTFFAKVDIRVSTNLAIENVVF